MSTNKNYFSGFEPSDEQKITLQKLCLEELVIKIQRIMDDNLPSDEAKLGKYFWEYSRRGGDISYFTVGAGAPGNCLIM